jgi:hypothetical protein
MSEVGTTDDANGSGGSVSSSDMAEMYQNSSIDYGFFSSISQRGLVNKGKHPSVSMQLSQLALAR